MGGWWPGQAVVVVVVEVVVVEVVVMVVGAVAALGEGQSAQHCSLSGACPRDSGPPPQGGP